MSAPIDLEGYFLRIGYVGPCEPDLEVVRALHVLHPQAIAFENLDPLLKRTVRLDPIPLADKLIRSGRGGFCFEHNLLFGQVLRAIGCPVRGLSARVLWNAPEGVALARTHMVLRVDIGGVPHLADVGFGGLTLTAPIRLEVGVEQPTPHERFRLLGAAGDFVLQARIGASWRSLYSFDLQEQTQADYEVANWYHCTNPNSPFNSSLIAARPQPGRRYGLRDRELVTHHPDGNSDRQTLRSVAELRDTLTDLFGLTLPAGPELDAVLARIGVQTT
jgi:N-hydroxyarylamine O-acetyltransferase